MTTYQTSHLEGIDLAAAHHKANDREVIKDSTDPIAWWVRLPGKTALVQLLRPEDVREARAAIVEKFGATVDLP